MKECPTCQSKCFDDSRVCFGCMHRFDEDERESTETVEVMEPPAAVETMLIGAADRAPMPLFPAGRSGRVALRRRGAATSQHEGVQHVASTQQVQLPGSTMGYQLVVSLQPMCEEA